MMTLRDQLLRVAHLYAAAVGSRGRDGQPSLSSPSMRVFGDGKTFARLAAGGDLTTGNYERAMRWFSDNWPEGADWPSDVARPRAPAAGPEAA